MNIKEQPTEYLLQRRTTLSSQIHAISPHIIRGSLIERYIRCGKPGCKCAETPGHGPKYYLSVSNPSHRPEQTYVLQNDHARVSEHLANYKAVKEMLEEISCINRELLRRRDVL